VKLTPLKCADCGGSPPLAAAAATPCPFCGASVAVPPDYARAFEAQRAAREARAAAEPLWRRLRRGAPPWTGWVGAALVLLLPSLAVAAAHLLLREPLASAEVIALFAVPALLPGGALLIASGAFKALGARFHDALAATPPAKQGDPPGCRECGAGLSPAPDALAASCAYCGTDSVLDDLPVAQLKTALSAALVTLSDGVRALRRRRATLALGVLGLALIVAALAVALRWAIAATL
jgi:predicted RNA-binding Zn-ribbon protein involved in translation (DUF1610 family)